jgi:hypothetical protein
MSKSKHPPEAAYVSADGLVSFDRYGRKLDSIGNVAWGDYQSAGDAGAEAIQRPQAESPVVARTFEARPDMGAKLQRSTWDNSVLPSAPTGAQAQQRPVPPGVLAPGGVDPATGKPVPTAFNGMLEQPERKQSAWRQPWMNPQSPTSTYEAQQRSRGFPNSAPPNMVGARPQQTQSYVPPTQNNLMPAQMQSYVPPVQTTPSLFPNPPQFTGYSQFRLPDVWVGPGEQAQPNYWRIPDAYIPETYSRPLDVYDPNQMSWLVP